MITLFWEDNYMFWEWSMRSIWSLLRLPHWRSCIVNDLIPLQHFPTDIAFRDIHHTHKITSSELGKTILKSKLTLSAFPGHEPHAYHKFAHVLNSLVNSYKRNWRRPRNYVTFHTSGPTKIGNLVTKSTQQRLWCCCVFK